MAAKRSRTRCSWLDSDAGGSGGSGVGGVGDVGDGVSGCSVLVIVSVVCLVKHSKCKKPYTNVISG